MYNTASPIKGAESGDQVKPEQHQVGQVVFGQRFGLQVGVDQAQPPQPFTAQGVVLQVGDQQPFFCADQDQFNGAVAIDQQADLAAQFKGKFKQATGQFGRTEFVSRNTAAVETFYRLNLALFQACKVTVEFVNGMVLLNAGDVVAGINVMDFAGDPGG